jgi:hypothetical protein
MNSQRLSWGVSPKNIQQSCRSTLSAREKRCAWHCANRRNLKLEGKRNPGTQESGSPLSSDVFVSLFEWFIGSTPLCDSSHTYTRAVRPEPSPADLPSGLPAGVYEVSRFSCMKFLGVPWGLRPRRTEQKLALSLLSMLPSAHINRVGVRVVSFRGSMATPPILYLRFAGSLAVPAQDSRPSGSLLLSCKALSSSTFMPVYPGALTSRLHSLRGFERYAC